MTDGGQAAPGWYPDPYQPSRLRYWDGEVWTEHYHQDNGELPSIGTWLNSTFGAIGAYGIPALALAVGASVVLSLITFGGLYWVVGDASVVNEEFIGDVGPLVVRGAVVVLAIMLAQGFVWLAINRFMQRAHLQAEPSIGEALSRAVSRLPRLVGVSLLVLFGGVAIFVILLIVAATGSGALVVLFVLAMIPLIVYLSVKISFISAAVVASPMNESVIRSSAGVSKGRFWGVLGRVLLLSLGVGIVSAMISGALGGLGQPVDQNAISDIFVGTGDNVRVTDFEFRDLLPSAGSFLIYVVVSSVINGLSGLVTTSGMMRLYLDSGAPSEL